MVDPENEERLLKIPPHVVAEIRAKGHAEAREVRAKAIRNARTEAALAMCAIDTWIPPDEHNHVLAAIDALLDDDD